MFERTSILGGIRLVCPYHVEKKTESKNSWKAILSSVGVLIAVGCLVYRNKEKFQFRPCNSSNVSGDNDELWIVEFEGNLEKPKKNKPTPINRSEMARSWVDASSKPALGIPLSSCVFPSEHTEGTVATAPPASDLESVYSAESEVPRTYHSNQSDYSVVSVDRAPSVGGSDDDCLPSQTRRRKVFIKR